MAYICKAHTLEWIKLTYGRYLLLLMLLLAYCLGVVDTLKILIFFIEKGNLLLTRTLSSILRGLCLEGGLQILLILKGKFMIPHPHLMDIATLVALSGEALDTKVVMESPRCQSPLHLTGQAKYRQSDC
jgi:hypothetical protein